MKRETRFARIAKVLAAAALPVAAGLLVAGCGEQQAATPQAPPVTVGRPTVQSVREYVIFTGSTQAVESADVMARVAGTLETVEFEPSARVSRGDLLFTIEKERYRAARDAAEAALRSAEADLALSETELARVERASRSRAVSESDVDRARATRDMAIATVALRQAELDDAELTYGYTDVVAPIDGVVNRWLIDPGNLVGQTGPTLLTRVNKLRPIYAYFNAPELVVLRFLSNRARFVAADTVAGPRIAARLAVAGDEGFPHAGYVDYMDNEVDPSTGTIEMRVRLENEELALFPGLFVRIRMDGPEIPDAVLVPQVAVGTDLGGKYVLTVGEDDVVEQIYVQLGEVHGDDMVHVREGLEGTETIIVNGLVFARPGLPVTPLTPEQFAAMRQQQAAGK